MRVTEPRRAICEVLARSGDEHLSASDVKARAEEVLGRRIDLSTVYRTVEALGEAGVAHHVHLGSGASVIHLSQESDHHHLTCEVCERTVDLPWEELAPLADLLSRHGFVPDTVHFAIVARCHDHT